MQHKHNVQENEPALICLSEVDAQTLQSLGRELSSKSSWWGEKPSSVDRSVVRISQESNNTYKVTFQDVVGVVQIGQHQINVAPKISAPHFWHVLSHSSIAPRISTSNIKVDEGNFLTELVATWCVAAAEKLLFAGLRKDYLEQTSELDFAQGQIQPLETSMRLIQGVPVAICRHEDLSDDSPMNRVVKAACERISKMQLVTDGIRTRARRVVYRMDGIGHIKFADMRAKLDRLTTRYSQVLPLSLMLLNGTSINANHGEVYGLSFLIRTPELIEDGLRSILATHIVSLPIKKRKLFLGDSGLSINPDLVFGNNLAIGDVKYRRITQDWSRSDLYQAVAFATGFRSSHAAIFGFSEAASNPLPRSVKIGDVDTRAFTWISDPNLSPKHSESLLATQVSSWLLGIA